MRGAVATLVFGLSCVAACAPNNGRFVVLVDSDIPELTHVEVTTTRLVGAGEEARGFELTGPPPMVIPFSFAVEPNGHPDDGVQIVVAGYDHYTARATPIVTRTVRANFIAGSTRLVRILLTRSCSGMPCVTGATTCVLGACQMIRPLGPDDLPILTHTGQELEDAATDAGSTDTGLDARIDATATDSAFDAPALDTGIDAPVAIDVGLDAPTFDVGIDAPAAIDAGMDAPVIDASIVDVGTDAIITFIDTNCSLEICNGLDDDCNGAIDDAAPCATGETCYGGHCSTCVPGAMCTALVGGICNATEACVCPAGQASCAGTCRTIGGACSAGGDPACGGGATGMIVCSGTGTACNASQTSGECMCGGELCTCNASGSCVAAYFEVCLGTNFMGGCSQIPNRGDPARSLPGLNAFADRISSVRIVNLTRATLYENSGYLGRSVVFTADCPDLSGACGAYPGGVGNIDNAASSLTITP